LILVFIKLKIFNSILKLSIFKEDIFIKPILPLYKSINNKYPLVFNRKISTNIKDLDKDIKLLNNIYFKE